MNIENIDDLYDQLCKKDPTHFTNEELLEIVFSEKHKDHHRHYEISMLAATQSKLQQGFSKYPVEELEKIYANAECKWSVILAAINTGNLEYDKILTMFLGEKDGIGSSCAEAFILLMKRDYARLAPDSSQVRLAQHLFEEVHKLNSDYEIKLMADFKGRYFQVVDSLSAAIAEIIDWKNISVDEMLQIITISNNNHHIVTKVVCMNKLSADALMTLHSLGILSSNSSDHALQNAIGTGKLSKDQIFKMVDGSGHRWCVVTHAVKTKLFSGQEMLLMWEKSGRDHGVAYEILKTEILSEDEKNTDAGKRLVEMGQ